MNSELKNIRNEFAKNEPLCREILGLFQLLSNKSRFRILCLLARGEFCVNEIVAVVDPGKLPNISQQLKILSLAKVIERRRDQQHILYSLKDQRVKDVVLFLRREFLPQETFV